MTTPVVEPKRRGRPPTTDRTTNVTFARDTGVSPATASKLRTGGRLPSVPLLLKIVVMWDLDAMSALRAYARGKAVFAAWMRVRVFDDPREGDMEIVHEIED